MGLEIIIGQPETVAHKKLDEIRRRALELRDSARSVQDSMASQYLITLLSGTDIMTDSELDVFFGRKNFNQIIKSCKEILNTQEEEKCLNLAYQELLKHKDNKRKNHYLIIVRSAKLAEAEDTEGIRVYLSWYRPDENLTNHELRNASLISRIKASLTKKKNRLFDENSIVVWKPSLGCGIKAIHLEMKPPDPRAHSELSVRSCVSISLPSEYYSQENLHEDLATYFAHGEERVTGWEKKGATKNQAFKFILQCCLGYVPTEDRVFRIPTSLISV